MGIWNTHEGTLIDLNVQDLTLYQHAVTGGKMPLRNAVVGDTVQYRNAKGETMNATVRQLQPAIPAAGDFTVANSGTGGTLGVATYSYKITNVVNGVESAPVAAAKTTVVGAGATNKCTITFPNATATSTYGVYGRVGAAEVFIAYVTPGVAGTYDDTGAITPSGAQPTADGRVGLINPTKGLNAAGTGKLGVTAIKASAMRGSTSVNRYFIR